MNDRGRVPVEINQPYAKAKAAYQHVTNSQEATRYNCRSTVVFRTAADEAKTFAHQFGQSVTQDDFTNLACF